MPFLPPLRLTGATILREGELRQRSVAIARGKISKGPLPAVDLTGFLILPGIIDMMALPPALTGPQTPARILREAQRQAAAAGVTTGWLAAGWSWQGGHDCPERGEALLRALAQPSGPVDLRPALRVETARSDLGPRLSALIAELRPQLLYFENTRDRLDRLEANDPVAFAAEAATLGLDAARLRSALCAAQTRAHEVPRHLCRIAEALDAVGAHYGSLDDSGGDIRESYSMIGARLATRPAAHSAAAASRAMGNPVLIGAGQHGLGDDLLQARLGNALVSDGNWPALAARALALAGRDFADLPRVWPLVSATPAEIMGLADRGTLDYGRRADLAVVNAATRRVEATICAGRLAHLSGLARERFKAAWNTEGFNAIAAE